MLAIDNVTLENIQAIVILLLLIFILIFCTDITMIFRKTRKDEIPDFSVDQDLKAEQYEQKNTTLMQDVLSNKRKQAALTYVIRMGQDTTEFLNEKINTLNHAGFKVLYILKNGKTQRIFIVEKALNDK